MLPVPLQRLVRVGRRVGWTWRYGFNLVPTVAYRFARQDLSPEGVRILQALNETGIALSSVNKLLPDPSLFQELSEAVDFITIEQDESLREKQASATDTSALGAKTFNVELLGHRPTMDPQSVFARFALQPQVLGIANAYFGMFTRLRYYNVWLTFATQCPPRESQLWHYDREDHFILKMFVYLSDVDEDSGPFTYARGSHLKRGLKLQPEHFMEQAVRRSTDEQMARVAPPDEWIKAVGPRGSIVFADTRGYHKGGLARETDRLMYLCMFTSQASQSEELFEFTHRLNGVTDKATSFAIANPFRKQE